MIGGVGLAGFAVAAFLTSTYFIVGDTSCALVRWPSSPELCRPTLARWAAVVALLVAAGLTLVVKGAAMARSHRPDPG